jgi:hypothetical protein
MNHSSSSKKTKFEGLKADITMQKTMQVERNLSSRRKFVQNVTENNTLKHFVPIVKLIFSKIIRRFIKKEKTSQYSLVLLGQLQPDDLVSSNKCQKHGEITVEFCQSCFPPACSLCPFDFLSIPI